MKRNTTHTWFFPHLIYNIIFINVFILGWVALAHLHLLLPTCDVLIYIYAGFKTSFVLSAWIGPQYYLSFPSFLPWARLKTHSLLPVQFVGKVIFFLPACGLGPYRSRFCALLHMKHESQSTRIYILSRTIQLQSNFEFFMHAISIKKQKKIFPLNLSPNEMWPWKHLNTALSSIMNFYAKIE